MRHATFDADVSLVMPVRAAAACAATAVVQHQIQQRYVFTLPVFAWGIISPPGGGFSRDDSSDPGIKHFL
jgi:hypothetical protein